MLINLPQCGDSNKRINIHKTILSWLQNKKKKKLLISINCLRWLIGFQNKLTGIMWLQCSFWWTMDEFSKNIWLSKKFSFRWNWKWKFYFDINVNLNLWIEALFRLLNRNWVCKVYWSFCVDENKVVIHLVWSHNKLFTTWCFKLGHAVKVSCYE